MKQLYLLAFATCFLASTALGQGLKFASRAYDLGRVPAKGGCKFGHKFKFVNKGDKPIHVHEVKASCGCTIATWTKTPVAPGEEGFVVATFDPKGQAGPVNKSISVSSDGIDLGVEVLFLKAFVVLDSACSTEASPKPVAKKEPEKPAKPKPEPKKQVTIPQPFKHTFSYGHSKIDLNDPRLLNWLKQVENLVAANGQVEVQVESSASKVPTGGRFTNQALAQDRARNTQALIKRLLKERGIKASQILFDEPEVLVQGPDFADDAKENPAKYEAWQYVKVKVN